MTLHLTSKKMIKELLNQHNLKPLKRMGQNFLISANVVDKVVSAADLKPSDIVLEVGPGLGALTVKIAEKAKQVIAVEKDRKLASVLGQVLEKEGIENVEIVNNDILNFQFNHTMVILRGQSQQFGFDGRFSGVSRGALRNAPGKPEGSHNQQTNNETLRLTPQGDNLKQYKLIANLPYNIATAVIMQFLEAKNPPKTMVVMLQKEVGKRICAIPPNMSRLSVFAQFYSTPEIIGYVSKRSFYPQPKVDSIIIRVRPRSDLGLTPKFSEIVKAGFSHPRKQLVNNLSKGLHLKRQDVEQWLCKNNIQPTQRAETLTINDWLNLTKTFQPFKN